MSYHKSFPNLLSGKTYVSRYFTRSSVWEIVRLDFQLLGAHMWLGGIYLSLTGILSHFSSPIWDIDMQEQSDK